jgi:cupin superfamily acireductone dioxygenase involved in methionine salvage
VPRRRRQGKIAGDFPKFVKAYDEPAFLIRIEKAQNSLAAMKIALEVQEEIAQRYGLTYDQYIKAVRYWKNDPDIQADLKQVKEKMKVCHKFGFEIKNPAFAD